MIFLPPLHRRVFLPLLCLLPLCLGCGKGAPALVPIEGRIVYRGQPVDAGTVVFTPDSERGNFGPIAWAEIQADGRFRLQSEERDGAVLGWHRITVAGSCQQQILPSHYRDPERSQLIRELKTGETAPVELVLD